MVADSCDGAVAAALVFRLWGHLQGFHCGSSVLYMRLDSKFCDFYYDLHTIQPYSFNHLHNQPIWWLLRIILPYLIQFYFSKLSGIFLLTVALIFYMVPLIYLQVCTLI